MSRTVLGRFGDADEYLSCADEWCQHAGAALFRAHNDLLWARLLHVRDQPGDSDRARAIAQRAVAVAEARGYAGIARHAAPLTS